MSNKLYDILKWCGLTVFPLLVICVNTILKAVGVPADTLNMISTILGAIETLLVGILAKSTSSYYKSLIASDDPEDREEQ